MSVEKIDEKKDTSGEETPDARDVREDTSAESSSAARDVRVAPPSSYLSPEFIPVPEIKAKKVESMAQLFQPQKYKKQELIKNEDGSVKLEVDEQTGLVTKTLKLSDPLIPEGEAIDPLYTEQYHKVSALAGKRVKYVILGSDKETVIRDDIDCAKLDLS